MRQRIEDLGRIAVMLDKIIDSDLFSFYQGRQKDFVDHFETLSKEDQDEMLHKMIYGIAGLSEDLHKVYEIAMGWDTANQPDDF